MSGLSKTRIEVRRLECPGERFAALETSRDLLAPPKLNLLLAQPASLDLPEGAAISQNGLEADRCVLREKAVTNVGPRLQLVANLECIRAPLLEFDGCESQGFRISCRAEEEEVAAALPWSRWGAFSVEVNRHEGAQGPGDGQGTTGFAATAGLTGGGQRLSQGGQQRRRRYELTLRFLVAAHWLCSASATLSNPEGNAPDSQSRGISRTSDPLAPGSGSNRHAPT